MAIKLIRDDERLTFVFSEDQDREIGSGKFFSPFTQFQHFLVLGDQRRKTSTRLIFSVLMMFITLRASYGLFNRS